MHENVHFAEVVEVDEYHQEVAVNPFLQILFQNVYKLCHSSLFFVRKLKGKSHVSFSRKQIVE